MKSSTFWVAKHTQSQHIHSSDSLFGKDIVEHRIKVPVSGFPTDIHSLAGLVNPREAKIKGQIYKSIKLSLTDPIANGDTEGLFDLRHGGITIVASKIEVGTANDQGLRPVHVYLSDNHGIANGGHTYAIIKDVLEEYAKTGKVPPNEYLDVKIIVGLDDDQIAEISRGLNTTTKVTQLALANQDKAFDWIKEALAAYPFVEVDKNIAWVQNEDKPLSGVSILKYLTCFDLHRYPTDNYTSHPVEAYNKADAIVGVYEKNKDKYESLKNLVFDICRLHDLIVTNAYDWLPQKNVTRIFDPNKARQSELIFVSPKETGKLLYDGLSYPILAALRVFCRVNDDGLIVWRDGFDYPRIAQMLADGLGSTLVGIVKAKADEHPANAANAVAKSPDTWSTTRSACSDALTKILIG